MRHTGGEIGVTYLYVREMSARDRAWDVSFYRFYFATVYKNLENHDITSTSGRKCGKMIEILMIKNVREKK